MREGQGKRSDASSSGDESAYRCVDPTGDSGGVFIRIFDSVMKLNPYRGLRKTSTWSGLGFIPVVRLGPSPKRPYP